MTRTPEGSIDALAKALGLIADQNSETISAPPWLAREGADVKSSADVHIEAIEARLSLLEKGLSLVQAQLGRSEEWQVRMERSFGQMQESLRAEFQMASRIVLGAAGALAAVMVIGHWI